MVAAVEVSRVSHIGVVVATRDGVRTGASTLISEAPPSGSPLRGLGGAGRHGRSPAYLARIPRGLCRSLPVVLNGRSVSPYQTSSELRLHIFAVGVAESYAEVP